MSKKQRDVYKENGWVFKCYRSTEHVYYDENTDFPEGVALGYTCKAEKGDVHIVSEECASRDEARTNVCNNIKQWEDTPKQTRKD
tara:strand:+ start:65533 stop:65787 length:255 start_codon:yes stop_codon:yes gene_type:complete